jgi:anti-sigma factor RsiW
MNSDKHDFIVTQLSSLVDDGLTDSELASVRSHLEECEQCRVTLEQLRAVKTWLASDGPSAADHAAPEAWSDLRARFPTRSDSWHRLAIAASLLLIVGASATWWIGHDRRAVASSAASNPSNVTQLETLARSRLAGLPVAKSQALASSLNILDRAIADARSARMADPSNDFIATYVDELLKRKADALREVIEMADAEGSS